MVAVPMTPPRPNHPTGAWKAQTTSRSASRNVASSTAHASAARDESDPSTPTTIRATPGTITASAGGSGPRPCRCRGPDGRPLIIGAPPFDRPVQGHARSPTGRPDPATVSSVATLVVEGDKLVVRLTGLEKAEAMHGDVREPLAAVRLVRVVADPWPELRGIRAPGTGYPGKIAVGTRRGSFGKDFAAVHSRGTAVVVDLEGSPYSRFVVTADDAAAVADTIRRQLPGH